MAVSIERIRADIEAIARFTETPGHGATRPTFSEAWGKAREYVIGQAEAAGCAAWTDAAGNVHARASTIGSDERVWLCGSHIDTVPHGGDYDGVAGVVVALELLRSAHDDALHGLPLELIVFAEEEGPTFGLGMIGSRAWVGELDEHSLHKLKNAAGQSYIDAGAPYGVDPERLVDDRLDPKRYLGLVEVHIEQGPGMWGRNQQLAVVRDIAGRRQIHVTVRGEANHAGATSMRDRRDALAGAAECMVSLELYACQIGNGNVVLTVGRIENHPNAITVVSDRVAFTIDFRSGDTRAVEFAFGEIRDLIEGACGRRRLSVEMSESECIAARPMDARLVNALTRLGGGLPNTVSGALHDSAILAPHLPTVMLFIPSKGGISHNPAEFSRVEDIAAAAALVERLVRRPTLSHLNRLNAGAFVHGCGPFFEHSPWIAERTHTARPFSSLKDLHEKLCQTLHAAAPAEKLALIRAHPDLIGRLAREGRLTAESTAEQRAAGLLDLSPDEVAAFERYNAAYRERFGFPFVICARENRKDAILAAFPERLRNTRDQEIAAALAEIEKIAWLRLSDAIWED